MNSNRKGAVHCACEQPGPVVRPALRAGGCGLGQGASAIAPPPPLHVRHRTAKPDR